MDQQVTAVAADLPFRLKIEQPAPDSMLVAGAPLAGFGWVLCAEPILSITVYLDDLTLCQAILRVKRSDVAEANPAYPNHREAGFVFTTTLPAHKTGPATLRVSARTPSAEYVHEQALTLGQASPAAPPPVPALSPILARVEDATVNERGILRVAGWAACFSRIESVRVFAGDRAPDRALGTADIDLRRDDVADAHGDYPNAGTSGFLLQRELSEADLATRSVRVVICASGGITRELTADLVVAPVIRRGGNDESIRLFVDTIALREDGLVTGVGWTICPSGVAAVRIEVDGQEVGQADTGIDRPDVAIGFPHIPNARKAGFRFAIQTDRRWQGEYPVRITAMGKAGEARAIVQPVLATAPVPSAAGPEAACLDAEPLKFHVDAPAVQAGRAVEPVRGFMLLNGWAFADSGIAGIEILVDGQSQGNAFTGIRREDLQAAFPNRDALLSGFAMLVPPQVMKPGEHDVRVVVRDNDGHVEEVAFKVDAQAAPEGPGPWQLRQKLKQAEIDVQARILAGAAYQPHVSLLAFLQDTDPVGLALLRQTIESLNHQAYPEWRLTIAVPMGDTDTPESCAAAPDDWLAGMLSGLDDLAARIDVIPVSPETSLAGFVRPDGFLALLTPGDRLGEDALLEFCVEGAAFGRPDFLYSDERRTDPADGAVKAFFKPDWSPDLLLSTNYIGRLWLARADLVRRAAITVADLLTYGDYHAVLRLTENASTIAHIPKVLCARADSYAEDFGMSRLALQMAAFRRGIPAQVESGCLPGIWRMKYAVAAHEAASALVSIIMPSIAGGGLIKTAILSIRANTAWPAYEIIVLDNIGQTTDPEQLRWKAWMRENADIVIEIDEPFNWSRLNNLGATHASGEFLLFLNDDIEVLEPGWLHGLIEHAQRPDIGVVGPQLLYPDGRVQHAGIFLSHHVGRHAFRFYPRDAPGLFGLALTQRNVISVTGACMLTRRDAFDAVGGFDEAHAIINNDLDFSLRLQRAGYRVVYTPHVTLIHHEKVSRSKLKDIYDTGHFDAAWKDLFLRGDPYFHPLLSKDYDDYLTETEPLRQFQAGNPLIAHHRIRRILAVKLDHIGDFIAAFPAFRRIKEIFPNAQLCVLAARASLPLAALEPAIDRIIEFNFFHARSEAGRLEVGEPELEALRAQLAPLRFDLALDLRRQSDTRKILQYTGARWLAGFDEGYRNPWLDIAMEFEGDVARNFKRTHVSEALVQFIDSVASSCKPERRVIRHARQPGEEAVQALRTLPAIQPIAETLCARPLVCVHTGAGAANKQWPPAHFAGLIDLLTGQLGVHVLMIGGPDEAGFAATVTADLRRPGQVFSVIGHTALADLPTILLACRLYVGNDSGPKHLAAALGVPTVGIHSGSVDAGEWGPMGELTLTLRRDMTCGPCYIASAADCPRALACLTGISVGDVFRACRRMLAVHERNQEKGLLF